METWFGKETPKLGFGLMRLPKLADGSIDIQQTSKMVDLFLEAGMTYFDTAFVYDNGDSERAAKAALVDRHPRDSFTLCTKLCAWMDGATAESAKQQFFTSLERTGAGYFDYYLLHALQVNNYKKFEEFGIWDFVKEQKAKGLIKHYGFSFHATPELLDQLLTEHPDVDFIQLQMNYADWENPAVQSRACYEVAQRHGKSVTVMEPVKGGTLANPPESVQKLFQDADPNASFASWAIRYIASMPGILTVLSGMSNVAQMEDNLSYMRDFKPMTEAENAVIREAQRLLSEIDTIPCTGCHYCTEGCPKQIPIPEIFSARNKQLLWNQIEQGEQQYARSTKERGCASDCIACGQCERVCPQQIHVITRLKDCAAVFDR